MRIEGNDFHYTVKGSWPFPLDMLRRDMAVAATPEDQDKIDLLSKPFAPDRDSIRNPQTINLVIRDCGRMRPLTARWRSFQWDVPEDREESLRLEEKTKADRMRSLYASAMAKLTDEEREAIDWMRPAFNG